MNSNVVPENKRKSQRIQSSLTLLMDACRYWAKSFNSAELLEPILDMELIFDRLDLDYCSDDSVKELEKVTMSLINNMDQFLKSMGQEGIEFNLAIH